jgi:hypothetical protein
MSMKRPFSIAAVLATLAACGGEGGTEITAPAKPSLDGGVGFGSGHRSDTTAITTTTTDTTSQRGGGVGFGSGH